VHACDVAECNVLALAATGTAATLAGYPVTAVPARTLRAYNVASGTPHTVGEMAAELAVEFGGAVKPKITGEYRLGDVRHIVASPRAAARDLGFRARIGFEEGMAEFARAPLRAPAADGGT